MKNKKTVVIILAIIFLMIIIFLIIFTIGCSQTFDPTDINERIDELAEKNEEQDGKIRAVTC